MRDFKIFATAFVVCAIALGVLASLCHAAAADVTMRTGGGPWPAGGTAPFVVSYENHDHLGRGILGADFALHYDPARFEYVSTAAVCPGACPPAGWIMSPSSITGLVAVILYTATPDTYVDPGPAVEVSFRNKTSTVVTLCDSGMWVGTADVGAANGAMSLFVAPFACATDVWEPVKAGTWAQAKALYR